MSVVIMMEVVIKHVLILMEVIIVNVMKDTTSTLMNMDVMVR